MLIFHFQTFTDLEILFKEIHENTHKHVYNDLALTCSNQFRSPRVDYFKPRKVRIQGIKENYLCKYDLFLFPFRRSKL